MEVVKIHTVMTITSISVKSGSDTEVTTACSSKYQGNIWCDSEE